MGLLRRLPRAWFADVVADSHCNPGESRSPESWASLCADIVVFDYKVRAPMHVLGLVAPATTDEIATRCSHIAACMGSQPGVRVGGTCVVFTAVGLAAEVASLSKSSLLWPSQAMLDAGEGAMHIVHDAAWTTAAVWQRRGNAPAHATAVTLPA